MVVLFERRLLMAEMEPTAQSQAPLEAVMRILEGREKKTDEIMEQHNRRIEQVEGAGRRIKWLIVISIVSLTISGLSALFTYKSKTADDLRSKREELRGTIERIVDLRSFIRNEPSGDHLMKQDIYIDAAEDLIKESKQKLSSYEYNILAREMYVRESYEKAERYGYEAINAAKDSKDIRAKNLSLRLQAHVYFSPGFKDFVKGREYYTQAVDSLKDTKYDYIKSLLAFTFELWGVDEIFNGFREEGDKKIELARQHYSHLEKVGYQQGAVEAMMKRVEGAIQPQQPQPKAE
jgi:hypothetical protein